MKRTAWWLLCIVISPIAAFLSDERTERLLSRATLKPPTDQ